MSCILLAQQLKLLKDSIETFNMDKKLDFIIQLAKGGNDASFIEELVYKDLFGKSTNNYSKDTLQAIVNAVKDGKVNKPEDIMKIDEFWNKPIIRNYKAYTYNLTKDGSIEKILETDEYLQKVIHDYTDVGYRSINSKHRKFWYEDNPNLEDLKWLTKLNKLFSYKGNYLGTTFRGTQVKKIVFNYAKPGDIVVSSSPISTTKNFDMAKGWAHGEVVDKDFRKVMFKIENDLVPQYDIHKWSMWPEEEEVLLEPNMPFKILKIEKGEIPLIHIKMIPLDTKELTTGKIKGIYNLLSFGGLVVALGHQREETK